MRLARGPGCLGQALALTLDDSGRRLGDPEAFRGAAEVQFLGHGDEVAEVTQFHAIDTYGILISSQAILDATRRAFLDCCDATSLEGLR